MRRLGLTIITGLALTAAYIAYAILIAPVVRVPQRPVEPLLHMQNSVNHRPAENVRVAQQWLAHHTWPTTAKNLLRTDEMFLYANEWMPRGDQGKILFRPFAAVWMSVDKEGQEQAFTICAESALLKFESNFDLDRPQPGRVTGGSLNGAVQIFGPDGLEIHGENFFFSEGTRSIFSHSGNQAPITFKFGDNQGEALSLTIKLLKSELPIARDRPNVVGIESVELKQNVRMALKLDDSPKSSPITVKCTGAFEYQVEPMTAVYTSNVVAFRRDDKQPNKTDRLLCDRLTVQFEPKPSAHRSAAATVAREKPGERQPEYQRLERNLQLAGLKAEGQRVGIASDKQSLKALMTLLTYDAKTRAIELSAPQAVKVEQRHNRLQCPKIRLILGPGNTLSEAVCLGAGWLESYDQETGELAFAADWMKQLRKSTDPETQLDLIELQQDASFRQPARETALGAETIRMWFSPLAPTENDDGDTGFQLTGNGADADPRRLVAWQQVALVSPQLEAETQQLEVQFDQDSAAAEPEQPLSRRPPRQRLQATSRTLPRPALPTPLGAFASVPPEEVASPLETVVETEAEPLPMIVSADRIRVRMQPPTSASESPTVSEIWTSGQVRVEHPSPSGKPLVVTGDRMHVENETDVRQVVHVYGDAGRPAHIRDERQQLHIEGQTIHFDRGENLAWVEGAGLLQLPVPKSFDGRELETPQLLDVWWKERMDFDGLLATFEGDVRAKLAEGKMECQTMQVALSRKVSFGEGGATDEKPEVQSVTCRDGVEFENIRMEHGQLLEMQKAKVFEFHLDHATKQTRAQGPGWMQMWRRGSAKRAGLAVTESVQANRVASEPASGWEYTRVDFAGQMTGQIAKRRTSFQEGVEVVYGPVSRPTEAFDKHRLPQNGGFMKCDSLQVAQTAADDDGKAFVQLLGSGNTRLEGRGFSGRADQVSYDETKGEFVLRSLGNHKATIWREKRPGAEPLPVHAQQLEFVPSEDRLKVIHAVSGEGAP